MSRWRSGSRTTFSASRHGCSTHAQEYGISSKQGIGTLAAHGGIVGLLRNRTVMIVLAYLWPLAFVPLLVEKQDTEVQWHAKHGLVLMVAELVLLVAYILMTSIVSLATFGLGCVLVLLLIFAWIGILGLHVAAILKGVNGGRLLLPGISEYADRF